MENMTCNPLNRHANMCYSSVETERTVYKASGRVQRATPRAPSVIQPGASSHGLLEHRSAAVRRAWARGLTSSRHGRRRPTADPVLGVPPSSAGARASSGVNTPCASSASCHLTPPRPRLLASGGPGATWFLKEYRPEGVSSPQSVSSSTLACRAQVVVGVSSRSQEFSADDAQEFSPSTILLILREIRPRVLACSLVAAFFLGHVAQLCRCMTRKSSAICKHVHTIRTCGSKPVGSSSASMGTAAFLTRNESTRPEMEVAVPAIACALVKTF